MSEAIGKKEANIIKRRINNVLSNFDSFTRHQLRHRLIQIGKYCYPHNQEAQKFIKKQAEDAIKRNESLMIHCRHCNSVHPCKCLS